jgi:predicted Zn finger-like uncharacterized protein
MTTSIPPLTAQCPACDSEFPVDPARVPARGIHAICSNCMRTFLVVSSLEDRTGRTGEGGTRVEADAPTPIDSIESEAPWVEEPAAPAQAQEEDFQDLTSLASEALAEDPGGAEGGREAKALASGAARFGRRDPHDRARRLARVLVSDIIAYYPDKHARAVEEDRIRDTFAEEVEKSRREYVEQVGQEMADTTDYFRQALNEVLARGKEVY